MKRVALHILAAALVFAPLHAMDMPRISKQGTFDQDTLWWYNLDDDRADATCPEGMLDLRVSPLYWSTFSWLLSPLKTGAINDNLFAHSTHEQLEQHFTTLLTQKTQPILTQNSLYNLVWQLHNICPEMALTFCQSLHKAYSIVKTSGMIIFWDSTWRSTQKHFESFWFHFKNGRHYQTTEQQFPLLFVCKGCNTKECIAYRYYQRMERYWRMPLGVLGCTDRAAGDEERLFQQQCAMQAFYNKAFNLEQAYNESQKTSLLLQQSTMKVGRQLLAEHAEKARDIDETPKPVAPQPSAPPQKTKTSGSDCCCTIS